MWHPVPFPGQRRRQQQGRRVRRKQTPTGLPFLPWQWGRAPGLLQARAHHLRRAAGPAEETETELPPLPLPSLKCADQLGHNLEEVADHAKVGDLEDRRV